MAHTTVALNLGQTLDVKRDVTAQIAFYHDVVFVDVVTDLSFFISSQILDAGIRVNSGTGENLVGSGLTNTINISQTNLDPLLARQIIITRPLRLMTLHFSQMGFTEGFTFMMLTSFITQGAYLERQVIRALVRS